MPTPRDKSKTHTREAPKFEDEKINSCKRYTNSNSLYRGS